MIVRAASALAVSAAVASGAAPTVSTTSVEPGVDARFEEWTPPAQYEPEYDGLFNFTRIRFGPGSTLRSFGGYGRGAVWAHDIGRAERNFGKIVEEVTLIEMRQGGGIVVDLDDPELFDNPIAYIVEVGYWRPNDVEVERLGEFLNKGGFLIVDDFRDFGALRNFIHQMERTLPDLAQSAPPGDLPMVQEIPIGHEVWNSFFAIPNPYETLTSYGAQPPVYLGIFEDHDPSKRLMVAVNFNQDLGEHWEYSDTGYYPINLSNEAYKFGVNYIVYAMTH